MHIFSLKEIKIIIGKQKIFKLEIDGKYEFEEFVKLITFEMTYQKEIKTIYSRLDSIANLILLPSTKFRNITTDKSLVKEYEIKTRNLRVYLFHDEHKGKIIVCGGKKTSQKGNIKHFREIIKQYCNYKITLL